MRLLSGRARGGGRILSTLRDLPRVASASGWTSVFRTAPIGVLVLGFLLFLVGAGLIMGGVVFAVSGRAGSWPVWVGLLAAGPLALYVGLHFVHGRRWAWVAVVTLIVLILGSAVVRALNTQGPPIAPLVEIITSAASLVYLFRPRVRREFR